MNNQKDLAISVIVPIYKTPQKFFEACLESLTCQTLKNIEFIMIFDGADEKLEKICIRFQEKDQRFKIYKQKQSGVSTARNLGILKSNGNHYLQSHCFLYMLKKD